MNTSTLSWRQLLVSVSFVLLGGLMSTNAIAQDDADDANAEDPAELGDIKVTGSRISRTSVEGAQPVTIITSNDIAVRGYTTVFEALKARRDRAFGRGAPLFYSEY